MRKTQTRILSLLLVLSLCIGLLAASGLKLTAKAADTSLTLTAGDNATTATVKYGDETLDSNAMKIGTSKATGSFKITVPAGSTSLSFYSASWNKTSGVTATFSWGDNSKKFSLTSDTGIANSTPFTMVNDPDGGGYKFILEFESALTEETEITVTADARAVFFCITNSTCVHEWTEAEGSKAATCTEDGTTNYSCSKCEETKTDIIPATGHNYGPDGVCTNCGYNPNTTHTIKEALDAENGTEVSYVTGVVTFINVGTSKTNVYIQDDEGKNGICLYVSSTELPYIVGDTVTVKSGTRAAYNGLPELEVTEDNIVKSSASIELKANDVTIDKLDESMLCTYVHLTDLEVTEVDDNDGAYTYANITVKDASEKTIQIYMAIMDKTTVGVGDTLDFTGALSIYKSTTLQLRNTLATEIKVLSKAETPDPTETTEPTESTETPETTETTSTTSNTYVLATEVKDGDQIILVNVAYNKAISAETNDSGYLLGVDVTPNSSKITTSNANIVWTVKVVDGGYQLVNADGKTISGTSGLGYGDSDNVWAFEFDGNTLKIKSTTLVGSSGDSKYIEWYDTYSDFSTYYLTKSDGTANDPALFNMNVYVLDPDATPVTPSGIPASGDSSRLVLAGVVMVMAVAAAAALVTQRKRFF